MGRLRILLVEDSADDEALTLMALRKNAIGSDVAVARDGREALDYLFREGPHAGRGEGQPELVLLDLKMPRLGGLEVLRRVRGDARTRLLPVVVLTTSNERQDLLDAYEAGANGYILKAPDFQQFLRTVEAVAKFWFGANLPPPQGGR